MHQSKYVVDLLAKEKMDEAKPILTPCATTQVLDSYFGDPLTPDQASLYRSLVGSLQYLSRTRPNLSFSVNQVCQYLHSPRVPHMHSREFCDSSKVLLTMAFISLKDSPCSKHTVMLTGQGHMRTDDQHQATVSFLGLHPSAGQLRNSLLLQEVPLRLNTGL